ncbi:MAG TPA: TetR/AcrR family transcriptional regulator [Moraxellaceae bacterium]|nr:TetR/AcrR family transcriptional regulator [Moraxellaceae bacterium]
MKKTADPTLRPRELAKQDTRDALLRAATALFREEGLDVSLDALCARAGYTRGAFYVHFRNRDELLSAVIERIVHELIDTLLGPEGSDDEFLVLVGRFLETVAAGQYPISRNGGLRPHQLLDACARSETVRLQYRRLIDTGIARLTAAVSGAQSRGELRADVPAAHVARMLMGLVLGMQTMMDLLMPLDLPDMARTVLSLLSPARDPK